MVFSTHFLSGLVKKVKTCCAPSQKSVSPGTQEVSLCLQLVFSLSLSLSELQIAGWFCS